MLLNQLAAAVASHLHAAAAISQPHLRTAKCHPHIGIIRPNNPVDTAASIYLTEQYRSPCHLATVTCHTHSHRVRRNSHFHAASCIHRQVDLAGKYISYSPSIRRNHTVDAATSIRVAVQYFRSRNEQSHCRLRPLGGSFHTTSCREQHDRKK